jgi:hypothetical protein
MVFSARSHAPRTAHDLWPQPFVTPQPDSGGAQVLTAEFTRAQAGAEPRAANAIGAPADLLVQPRTRRFRARNQTEATMRFSSTMLFASLALLATGAAAQVAQIVKIDPPRNQVVLDVDGTEQALVQSHLKFFDADGRSIRAELFAPREWVSVTKVEDRISSIRKLREQPPMPLGEATVVGVDLEKQQITLKVEGVETTLDAQKLSLLDAEGNQAKLSSFRAGQQVKTTADDRGQITGLQHMKA